MAWHAEDTVRGLYRIDDPRLGAGCPQRLAIDLHDRSCPGEGQRLGRTIGHRATRISCGYSPPESDEPPIPHGGVNLEMAEWLPVGSGVRRAAVGIAPGCGPELFCPHRNATRAEVAAFINGVFIRPDTWAPASTSFE